MISKESFPTILKINRPLKKSLLIYSNESSKFGFLLPDWNFEWCGNEYKISRYASFPVKEENREYVIFISPLPLHRIGCLALRGLSFKIMPVTPRLTLHQLQTQHGPHTSSIQTSQKQIIFIAYFLAAGSSTGSLNNLADFCVERFLHCWLH